METGEGEGFYNTTKIGDKEEGEGKIILSFLREAEQQCQDLRCWGGKKEEDILSRVFVVLPCPTQQYGKSCHTLFCLAISAVRVGHKICLF